MLAGDPCGLISLPANQKGSGMEKVAGYRPSLWRWNKYHVYLNYFISYVRAFDFRSLLASVGYMFLGRLPGKDYIAASVMGKFLIRKGTTDFQFINPAYERRVKEYILDNLDSFDVFVDVGACIGEYSIWLAGLGKQCIAIEPINYLALENNIDLNGLDHRIKAYRCGLGNKQEYAGFVIPDGLPSSSYRDKNIFSSGRQTDQVLLMTMDSLLNKMRFQKGIRFLVKLDVEGMETEVIEGGRDFIRDNDVTFIYEHFPEENFKNDKALASVAAFRFSDIDEVNRLAEKY
jgi:FkbM family methyltransferase